MRSVRNFWRFWFRLDGMLDVGRIDVESFLFVFLNDQFANRLVVLGVDRQSGLKVVEPQPNFGVVSIA